MMHDPVGESSPRCDGTRQTASGGRRLRDLLAQTAPCQLMCAYDGLSARIAAEEGFPALWASGFCISTVLAVRDSEEASWTQVLAAVQTMVDATDVPVLVDGDTGYGNFNTARLFSRRAERMGASGICIEDKNFPKMNSFYSDSHALAPSAEFCGKIRACKDAQVDSEFVVVARTEAFIAGNSVVEAVARAEAYAQAGADAIFVHSRQTSAVEIIDFMKQWSGRVPVIVSPTTYHDITVDVLQQLGVAGIIWANQSMRAMLTAIRKVCREVLAAGSISGVEGRIASLDEIFSLLNYSELKQDEAKYSFFASEK